MKRPSDHLLGIGVVVSILPLISVYLLSQIGRFLDLPGVVANPPVRKRRKSRRRFVRYDPSAWEANWTQNIDEWTADRVICDRINEQREFLHMFLSRACTGFIRNTTWCIQDDGYVTMYYDTVGRIFWPKTPPELKDMQSDIIDSPRPFRPTPEEELVFSKFTFRDELTGEEFSEYIEPLVSHLRHPLAMCLPGFHHGHTAENPFRYSLGAFRGFVVPPPHPKIPSPRDGNGTKHRDTGEKNYYFDGGASNWKEGLGGPSLSVLTELWKRNGIEFDEVYAYEAMTSPEEFYKTVPNDYPGRVTYAQGYIATSASQSASTGRPFLPHLIASMTREEDYVLFKLDIDTLDESSIVDHLISPDNNDCSFIDEFVWEHHLSANYLMSPLWGPAASPGLKISDSYSYFRKLRDRGVRAHSWV